MNVLYRIFKKSKNRIIILDSCKQIMAGRTISIDHILSQIKQLDYLERINLLEKLVSLIKKENVVKEKVKLSSLNGLGSEMWRGLNIDDYVEKERQWD